VSALDAAAGGRRPGSLLVDGHHDQAQRSARLGILGFGKGDGQDDDAGREYGGSRCVVGGSEDVDPVLSKLAKIRPRACSGTWA